MGINTKAYLILPKVVASLIMVPLLVILAAVIGIWGGRVAGELSGILSTATYDQGLLNDFIPFNVTFALAKAYTYAFIISSIPAYFGYHVKGGALEIGRSGTTSVIVSCILILFADYALAAILL
jgi:phospholipid/cholesterol/gamma-HCH transport system permease protein